MTQQDEVADALRDEAEHGVNWDIEKGTLPDGRDAVKLTWPADQDTPATTVNEDLVPYQWQITEFRITDGNNELTLAEPKERDERAIPHYDALARELTASELRDYVGVEHYGHSQTAWAQIIDKNRSNVSERVNSAKRKISGESV